MNREIRKPSEKSFLNLTHCNPHTDADAYSSTATALAEIYRHMLTLHFHSARQRRYIYICIRRYLSRLPTSSNYSLLRTDHPHNHYTVVFELRWTLMPFMFMMIYLCIFTQFIGFICFPPWLRLLVCFTLMYGMLMSCCVYHLFVFTGYVDDSFYFQIWLL